MRALNAPNVGRDLLDWRHFNDAIMKTPDEYDFECTARTCGKRYLREEILQKETVMSDFDKDMWRTPFYFVNWVKHSQGACIDGAANKENAVFKHWIGKGGMFPDFLDEDLGKSLLREILFINANQIFELRPVVFVNPPYSDVTPFLKQAKSLCDQGIKVVLLLNNDKSTQWYQNHIRNVANEVIDITGGRIAFIHPITGQENKGNSKGQMVVVFDPTMEDCVQRSISLDFIKQWGE